MRSIKSPPGTRGARLLLLTSVALTSSCGAFPDGEGAEQGAVVGSASGALIGSAPGEPERPRDAFCPPHSVDFATTVTPTASGVDVTITLVDPNDERSLADLSKHVRYLVHASATFADPTEALRGPGRTGDKNNNCPIIMTGTVVTSTPLDGGVRIGVASKSTSAEAIAEVQATAQLHLETIKRMHALIME